MLKAFKYRLYPTKQQVQLINKHFGCVRFVYNLALETKQSAYLGSKVNLSRFDLITQLPELKKECEWLTEVNSLSLQKCIIDLDSAYTGFFKGRTKFPNFKKKISRQSFNIPQNVLLKENKLVIPKFKEGIKLALDRDIKGTIKNATVSKTPTGKYFVSILSETGDKIPKPPKVTIKNTVGIDLGIKSYLVTSDGIKYVNPKFLKKSLSKLKFLQRKYSKYKGKRTRQKLAIQYDKVTNKRRDFLHKTSTELIKNHDSLAIENLQVSKMLKDHNLAQYISDASWATFTSMLEYKAKWYGKNILKIGQFDPSSKTCSNCGHINNNLTLNDREWECKKCNSLLDRDVNAAINIKNFALKNKMVSGIDTKNHDELPTLVGVLTHEA